jgi:hypothetical protein
MFSDESCETVPKDRSLLLFSARTTNDRLMLPSKREPNSPRRASIPLQQLIYEHGRFQSNFYDLTANVSGIRHHAVRNSPLKTR